MEAMNYAIQLSNFGADGHDEAREKSIPDNGGASKNTDPDLLLGPDDASTDCGTKQMCTESDLTRRSSPQTTSKQRLSFVGRISRSLHFFETQTVRFASETHLKKVFRLSLYTGCHHPSTIY